MIAWGRKFDARRAPSSEVIRPWHAPCGIRLMGALSKTSVLIPFVVAALTATCTKRVAKDQRAHRQAAPTTSTPSSPSIREQLERCQQWENRGASAECRSGLVWYDELDGFRAIAGEETREQFGTSSARRLSIFRGSSDAASPLPNDAPLRTGLFAELAGKPLATPVAKECIDERRFGDIRYCASHRVTLPSGGTATVTSALGHGGMTTRIQVVNGTNIARATVHEFDPEELSTAQSCDASEVGTDTWRYHKCVGPPMVEEVFLGRGGRTLFVVGRDLQAPGFPPRVFAATLDLIRSTPPPVRANAHAEICSVERTTQSGSLELFVFCERQDDLPIDAPITGGVPTEIVHDTMLITAPDTSPQTFTLVGTQRTCIATTTGRAFIDTQAGVAIGYAINATSCPTDADSSVLAIRGSYPDAQLRELVVDTSARGAAGRSLARRFGMPLEEPFRRVQLAHFASDPEWKTIATVSITEEDGGGNDEYINLGIVHGNRSHVFRWVEALSFSLSFDDRLFFANFQHGAAVSDRELAVYEIEEDMLMPVLVRCDHAPASFASEGCGSVTSASDETVRLRPNGLSCAGS